MQIQGSVALVTGANRGIGEAIVDALVAAGAKKVYAAARNISTLDPLVERHGARVVPLQLDVTNAAQIATAAATATDVDLLVNNAGIVGFFGGDFTDPKWIEGGREEMEVNFLGTFAVTQAFAPVLAKNGGGAIANLNSVASFVSFPILAAVRDSGVAHMWPTIPVWRTIHRRLTICSRRQPFALHKHGRWVRNRFDRLTKLTARRSV
jgi:NAD(P)-dependent dehydrogenase (short-subunit alcohol dehydrogenase family)